MKFVTEIIIRHPSREFSSPWKLTKSHCTIVRETLAELDDSNRVSCYRDLVWNSAKSLELFLGREGIAFLANMSILILNAMGVKGRFLRRRLPKYLHRRARLVNLRAEFVLLIWRVHDRRVESRVDMIVRNIGRHCGLSLLAHSEKMLKTVVGREKRTEAGQLHLYS